MREDRHSCDLTARCDAAMGGPRAACAVELALAAGAPPDWVELIPAGVFELRDGRGPFRNDDPEAVVAASRALAMDLPIDYDHQIEFAEENGQPAPAAGWIKELAVRAGGIWGRVEWTDRARAMLQAREYRYLSPVFNYDKTALTVTRLIRAGLTNSPAMYLTALAKSGLETEEIRMDPELKKLLKLLGLAEDAKPEAIAKAAADLTESSTAIAAIRGALKLADDVAAADVATALASALDARDGAGDLKAIARAAGLAETATAKDIATAVARAVEGAAPDPSKFVPRAEFDEVKTALATLQISDAEEKAAAAADAAIAEGKVTPGQRDWALSYARKDPEGFAAYAKSAPVIVKPGAGRTGGEPPKKADGPLDETERAICAAMGLTEEAFRKSRAQLEGAEQETAR